jgi:alpha-1,3-rhamnosyl/mannosyltransferase
MPDKSRLPLVVAGDFGWKFEPVIDTVSRLKLAPWVRFVGYVGMGDLPALYQMARVVAFPSLDEGFGFPILEAFASGVPVVATGAGAIPEVAGDAALLFDGHDEAAMAKLLQSAGEDGTLRERLITSGRSRAMEYTWGRAGVEHVRVYRDAAA